MATIPTGQKFHTVPSNVQTVERGSALANSQREIYTMQDIVDTTRPYKVFTALLTQSGGSSGQSISDSDLTIGVTYVIGDISPTEPTYDFTNVGAPNNNAGTIFVATGTTPNNWGNGILLYNTGTPIVTVLENTIGDVYFEVKDIGVYDVKSVFFSQYSANKTYLTIGLYNYEINEGLTFRNSFYKTIDNSTIRIQTQYTVNGYYWSNSDNVLTNTPIEIRLYNLK